MSRTNTRRRSGRRAVCVKLAWGGVDAVDHLAAEAGVTRSDMIRTLLGEAIRARRQQRTP